MNIENRADKIIEQFFNYTDGVRVLFLADRKKDGGKNRRNRQYHKKISKNSEDFRKILIEFLEIKNNNPKENYRIYSSVNSRDISKSIRKFKEMQLEADYLAEEDRNGFYFDVKNRIISSLMRPSSRKERNFLIDIDHNEGEDVHEFLKVLYKHTRNHFKYKTKNGWHVIISPMNPQLLEPYKVNKDGLLLLDY